MNLVRLLGRSARHMIVLTGVVAVLSGMCNAGLIAMAHRVLTRVGNQPAIIIWAFALLGLGRK